MNKIGLALSQTRTAEASLASTWLRVGERESVDHEWLYNARHFHTQCLEHIEDLAKFAPKYGSDIDEKEDRDFYDGLMGKTRHKISEMIGRRPESGLLLLNDQRLVYTLCYAVSFHWTVLGQVAQAMRDRDLLTMVDHNHKDILTQVKWVKAEIKVSSPQVLCA
ncbi:MAG TPA: hypothetical protein VFT62_11430 [Mycobacteriales bacterium]|nr:hypothetical protein [Mycobacteriales bacterium]